MVGELPERNLLAVRGGDEDVADLLRRLAEPGLQPDHQVEELLALHHLGRGDAADRRLDQAVDVGDVEAVARDPGAIDRDA